MPPTERGCRGLPASPRTQRPWNPLAEGGGWRGPQGPAASRQDSHPGHVLYGSGPDTGVVAGALEVLTPSVLLPDSATRTISQKEGEETPANPPRAHGSPVPVTKLLRPEVAVPFTLDHDDRPRGPRGRRDPLLPHTQAPAPSPLMSLLSQKGPPGTHRAELGS